MAVRNRSQDVGWQYGVPVENKRDRVACVYCQMEFSGGITRFKKHFVGKVGGSGPCASVPEEVREIIRQTFSDAKEKKDRRSLLRKREAPYKGLKIMTRKAMMDLRTSRDGQPDSVSGPLLQISFKEQGIRKRKVKDSGQQKKLDILENVQTESQCGSPLSTPSTEQDNRRKHSDTKQLKELTINGNNQLESLPDLSICPSSKLLDIVNIKHMEMEGRASVSVPTVPGSHPTVCIHCKEGNGKRKYLDSVQQKKIRVSGHVWTKSGSHPHLSIQSKELGTSEFENVQSEPVFGSCQYLASKELGNRKTKGMKSKQKKERRSSKKDARLTLYASYLPQSTRANTCKRIRGQSKRVDEWKKLDTNAFESFLEYLWSNLSDVKRKTCAYLDCLWFSLYIKGLLQSKVLEWVKKKQIFSRKYVFIPIICWRHWNLLILCHFGENLLSKVQRPCMLLLDSLGKINPMRLEPAIRRFVLDIYKSEGCEEEAVSKIPLLVPKVPQQRDGEKCGIFVLYFIHLFLQDAPESFNQEGYPYFLNENWFSCEDMESFHKEVLHFAREGKKQWERKRLAWTRHATIRRIDSLNFDVDGGGLASLLNSGIIQEEPYFKKRKTTNLL